MKRTWPYTYRIDPLFRLSLILVQHVTQSQDTSKSMMSKLLSLRLKFIFLFSSFPTTTTIQFNRFCFQFSFKVNQSTWIIKNTIQSSIEWLMLVIPKHHWNFHYSWIELSNDSFPTVFIPPTENRKP